MLQISKFSLPFRNRLTFSLFKEQIQRKSSLSAKSYPTYFGLLRGLFYILTVVFNLRYDDQHWYRILGAIFPCSVQYRVYFPPLPPRIFPFKLYSVLILQGLTSGPELCPAPPRGTTRISHSGVHTPSYLRRAYIIRNSATVPSVPCINVRTRIRNYSPVSPNKGLITVWRIRNERTYCRLLNDGHLNWMIKRQFHV